MPEIPKEEEKTILEIKPQALPKCAALETYVYDLENGDVLDLTVTGKIGVKHSAKIATKATVTIQLEEK